MIAIAWHVVQFHSASFIWRVVSRNLAKITMNETYSQSYRLRNFTVLRQYGEKEAVNNLHLMLRGNSKSTYVSRGRQKAKELCLCPREGKMNKNEQGRNGREIVKFRQL